MSPFLYKSREYEGDNRTLCEQELVKIGVNGNESKLDIDDTILEKAIGICTRDWDKTLWSKESCDDGYFALSTLEGTIKCISSAKEAYILPSSGGAGTRLLHKLVAPLSRDEHQAILDTL